MRNLFQFIIKHHIFALFLLLETVSLILVAQFNYYHKAKVVNVGTAYAGGLYNLESSVIQYFSLKKANEALANENARLKNFFVQSHRDDYATYLFNDSLISSNFYFQPARVINITTHKQKNFLTINRGSNNGIEPGMAVTSSSGVVGSVKGVSKNYSVVIPLINLNSLVSAKIDSSGYFGSLVWDGKDYRRAKLRDIEQNAKVALGQKIVTTGFGAYFPESLLIGTIEKITKDDEGIFYNIDVLLSTNFKQLYQVEVIRNMAFDEIIQLESEEINE